MNWKKFALAADKIKSNNKRLAEILLRKSIELSPKKPWPYFLLSTLVEKEEAIDLIKKTKKVEITEWYYINLIEKYTEEIKELTEEFLKLYNPDNLKDESAIIHWHQLQKLSEVVRNKPHGLSLKDIQPFKNKWDCIALLCTGKEYVNDIYLKFLKHISETANLEISKNINFKLIIKKQDINKYKLPIYLKDIFKHIEIIHINLPDHLDLYSDKSKEEQDQQKLEKYGSKYGPNFVFFKIMNFLSQYNTSMILECDCILYKDWMKRIDNYIDSQNFLISGSQSDSPNDDDFYHLRNQHINGGTAIYATGYSFFQKFIKLCEDLWPLYIKYKHWNLPYDYILLLVIENYFNYSKSKDDKILWSYIKKQYVYNNLIFNWSDKTYEFLNPEQIKAICNPAVLHQKPINYPGVFEKEESSQEKSQEDSL